MKSINIIIVIIFIIVIAAILRLIALDRFPAGFNADEAAIGYNAYSLLQTGKDEYGTTFPFVFKSFGDFKPGLYFYIVMPFVAILGLNEWAVRIPSALLGIATVILIYFLAKEIFQSKKIGILSAFLLAISPWHIHFSRGGWETNAATFFVTLGVFLFIKGLKNWKFLFWSTVSFLASMYTYQSPRLIVPVLLIILFFLYRGKLISILRIIELKKTILWVALLVLLTIPLVIQFISGTGSTRFSGLSFLSDTGPIARINELRGEHENLNRLDTKFIHNKLTSYGPEFLGHYLDHFKPDFLFINGDPIIRNKVPETGQFYLTLSLFLAVGLLGLINAKYEHKKLILAWILIAPAASSMTYQTPHALRALTLVIPLTLVIGYGAGLALGLLGKLGSLGKLGVLGLSLILTFEFVHYLESYYIHYPKRYPQAFEYGFKEMVQKLSKYEGEYNNVVITDRYDQSYILVLFYKKYDPQKYQPQAVLSPRDKFNFGTVRSFDKYQFRSIDPKEIERGSKILFIGTEEEIPKDAKILDKVEFPNGKPAFIFAIKKD